VPEESVTVTVIGTLKGVALPDKMFPTKYDWTLSANGVTYQLEIDRWTAWERGMEKLRDKPVVVTGTLVGKAVRVTDLRRDYCKYQREPDTLVTIRGRLSVKPSLEYLPTCPPITFPPRCFIRANGQTFQLAFATQALRVRVEELFAQDPDRVVVLKGVLKDGHVTVTELHDGAGK
jgi:hypothetical protein